MSKDFGFYFYTEYSDKLRRLSDGQLGALMRMIMSYKEDGVVADTEDQVVGVAFDFIRADIDKQAERYAQKAEAGRKGGISKPKQSEADASRAKQSEAIKEKRKEKEKEKQESNPLYEVELSPDVREAVDKWLAYKRERRESYKDVGLRALLSQVEKHERQNGAKAVRDVIELSMANGWRGIIWDRIGQQKSPPTNPFTNIRKSDYDFEALERALDEA